MMTLEQEKKVMRETLAEITVPTERRLNETLYQKKALGVTPVPEVGTKKEQKAAKEQNELNRRRLEHMQVLERSIEKNGSLRETYNDVKEECEKCIKHLCTDAEAEELAAKDKRRNQIPALFLSWLVMPLFVTLRSIELVFDSLFMTNRLTGSIAQKIGGTHAVFGRLSFPAVFGFYVAMAEFASEEFNPLKLLFFGAGYTLMAAAFMFFISVLATLVFTPINATLGRVCEAASSCFESMDAGEWQYGLFVQKNNELDHLANHISGRVQVINKLRELIRTNAPYDSEYDRLYSDKSLGFAVLSKKEDSYTKNVTNK